VKSHAERTELLEQLIRAHQARLRAYVFPRTGNADDSDDIVQDVFLLAYKKMDSLDLSHDVYPWLLTVARNELRNYWRSAARSTPVQELQAIAAERALEDEDSPPGIEYVSEKSKGLRQCIGKLPVPEREMINRVYVEGLNCEQLAHSMGKTGAAVRIALHRIRKILKECVELRMRRCAE
jgi:RNA polymerase sigma-70 factor (ECF subfamily)